MKAFRFPLDRVLHWRATQCELEEAAMARLTAQRGQLADALEQIARGRKQASEAISSQREIAAAEFQTIADFQIGMDRQKSRILASVKQLETEIASQQLRTAEARRKKKLLETLRESRLNLWTTQREAEDEMAAAHAWLSRYAAERYTTTDAPAPAS